MCFLERAQGLMPVVLTAQTGAIRALVITERGSPRWLPLLCGRKSNYL